MSEWWGHLVRRPAFRHRVRYTHRSRSRAANTHIGDQGRSGWPSPDPPLLSAAVHGSAEFL